MDRVAAALRAAVVGHRMTSFTARGLVGTAPRVGRTIEWVDGSGHSLWFRFDDDLIVRATMRGTGVCRAFPDDEPWDLPLSKARLHIGTEGWSAVCFGPTAIESYRTPDDRRHPAGGRFGPDLCDPNADLGVVVERLLDYAHPEAYLAEVMLDPRVFNGLGNVYRSEVLWLLEVSPWAMVCDLDHRGAIMLVDTAATMVRADLVDGSRRQIADTESGTAVYGRPGQGCPRCHDTVRINRIGRHGRSLYWCEGCQVNLDSRPVLDVDMSRGVLIEAVAVAERSRRHVG